MIIGVAAFSFAEQGGIAVCRSGRPIQVDGFLLEWAEKDANSIQSGRRFIVVDAISTPGTIAGYCRITASNPCQPMSFLIDAGTLTTPFLLTMPVDSPPNRFCAVQRGIAGSDTSITFEWALPKDSIATDSVGNYRVALSVKTSCSDTLLPVVYKGTIVKSSEKSGRQGSVTAKMILIGILLVLFAMLRVKSGRLKKQAKK
jgi:hypothetical protein